MMNASQEKQSFLREKIIDGGYDVNLFSEFLSKMKRLNQ